MIYRGALVAVPRQVDDNPRVATAALASLLAGPTADETARGLTTAIPSATKVRSVNVTTGTVTVDVSSAFTTTFDQDYPLEARVGQLACTMHQFESVRAVRLLVNGSPSRLTALAGAAPLPCLAPAP
jgi:spore germination protein GerM